MESVRLRRLKADHEALRRLAHLHPRIEIGGVFGNPPERYRVKLKVRSLREKGEALEIADEHWLEVALPRGYPRDAPLFRMLTPVFHPNIAPHAVCIGDNWTAGESLDLLIQRVGEILAYQSYNTKSPLNGRAAQWVDEHKHEVPIDRDEFFIDLSVAPPRSAEMAVPACANCGARGGALDPCSAGHVLCGDCVIRCRKCARVQCLVCGEKECVACVAASVLCKNCGSLAANVLGKPMMCAEWHPLCRDCGQFCGSCGTLQCVVCGNFPCRACA